MFEVGAKIRKIVSNKERKSDIDLKNHENRDSLLTQMVEKRLRLINLFSE